jgi:hypothetical protein
VKASKLSNIIRVTKSRGMRWTRHVSHMGDIRNACNILVGKREGKRPRGRTRRRWEDNIRMDLREIGWESVDWVHLAQITSQWRDLVKTVMKLPVPKRREISCVAE